MKSFTIYAPSVEIEPGRALEVIDETAKLVGDLMAGRVEAADLPDAVPGCVYRFGGVTDGSELLIPHETMARMVEGWLRAADPGAIEPRALDRIAHALRLRLPAREDPDDYRRRLDPGGGP